MASGPACRADVSRSEDYGADAVSGHWLRYWTRRLTNLVASVQADGAGFLLALIPVMFAYSGWNAASYLAGGSALAGSQRADRLGLGTLVVISIYLGLNALLSTHLAPPSSPRQRNADRHGGGTSVRICRGNLIAAFCDHQPRGQYQRHDSRRPTRVLRDGARRFFPASVARVHPRFRAPTIAIVAQAVWSGVLVLSGTLSQLVSYTGFAIVLFAGIAVVSLFVLRRRTRRRTSVPSLGYPWAPAIFVAASAAMVANEIWRNPRPSVAGLAIMAAGIPVYWGMRRKA